MPRRRYRLFAVGALVVVFLLYRVTLDSWDQPLIPASIGRPPPSAPQSAHDAPQPAKPAAANQPQEPLKEHPEPDANGKPKSDHVGQGKTGDKPVATKVPELKDEAAPVDGKAPGSTKDKDPKEKVQDEAPLHWTKPPNESPLDTPPAASKVHWTKPREHFPVPKESVISLPVGKASMLPKIQYDFGPESTQARAKRLERQEKVKAELKRTWAGYKKHAWMHDELTPVSGKHRDPFCGWAATLVDSLDTLWIAGMKDEFDEAANAVKKIDFTHTNRLEIPVFEVTIRYLGGLLAAFDISGGAKGSYSFLLDKAVELAEILMGVFDTPNRMPILLYHWKPEYASQPHIAGEVGFAELASLSMEFTRLAQLTAQNKYYDAIARITNALVDMQKAGTVIPGLFPEIIEASGCNRTATSSRDSLSRAAKDQMDAHKNLGEPEGFGGGSKTLNSVVDANRMRGRPTSSDDRFERRAAASLETRSHTPAGPTSGTTEAASYKSHQGPYAADGKKSEWDCVPQGLVPGEFIIQFFHLGSGQDSAYEYFAKEYLLLGGREPKYQKLYEDAVEAANKHLLFRPMMVDDWDVLFPAKASTTGIPGGLKYEYEVAHLTCFVGGMYGLGGKLFGRDKDIETAKKLTDGCVWAYQSTASGIMPEVAQVVPCPSLDKCEYNETRWWDGLDPFKEWRDEQAQKWEAEQQEPKRGRKTKDAASNAVKQSQGEAKPSERGSGSASKGRKESSDRKPSGLYKRLAVPAQDQKSSSSKDEPEGSKLPQSLKDKLGKGAAAKDTKAETSDGSKSWHGGSSSKNDQAVPVPSTPTHRGGRPGLSDESTSDQKPMSHAEYVKHTIEHDGIPPGFVSIASSEYLLRPEAIESVWYMYRITGDPSWMDKGWRMFEATVRATRTAIANSAVRNVLAKEPELKDKMESFWMGETLKYYYLLFSEPDVISLDEWVLNTEAHPLKL